MRSLWPIALIVTHAAAAAATLTPAPSYYVQYNDTLPLFSPYSCSDPCVRVGGCGAGTNVTCDPSALAAACDALAGCLAFDGDGWLRGCANASCGAPLQPVPGATTWVKRGGDAPSRPVAPVTDVHYPHEQQAEEGEYAAALPALVEAGQDIAGRAWALLACSNGNHVNASVGEVACGSYTLLTVSLPNHSSGTATSSTTTCTTSTDVVVERKFSRWAALSLLYPGGVEAARLRRSVGSVHALQSQQLDYGGLLRDQPSYYTHVNYNVTDYIGSRVLSDTSGEANFTAAAAYLPPVRDYGHIGSVNGTVKFSVSPDGLIKRSDGDIYTPATNAITPQPGQLVFHPADYLPYWPASNWSVTKSGLVGGSLRVVATAAFDPQAQLGFEQLAFCPGAAAEPTVYIRLQAITGNTAGSSSDMGGPYQYFGVSADRIVTPMADDGAAFYAALFAEQAAWQQTFSGAAQLQLPGAEGARQVDTAVGGIVTGLTLYTGLQPTYGNGGDYWTPGDALLWETGTLNTALLAYGLIRQAADRVGYYLWNYVDAADGTLNVTRLCSEGGFGDALSDAGELLALFVDTAAAMLRYEQGGAEWVAAHLPVFAAVTNYTLQLRLNASAATAPGSVTHGLIYGSPEHDTCRAPDYYYHNSAWLLRGLMAAGPFLREYGGPGYAVLAAEVVREVPRFRADLHASLELATVTSSDGRPLFVPPIAAVNVTPYTRMTESEVSEYALFRYWPDMLRSGVLPPGYGPAILAYRAAHGGAVSGLTRFSSRLDQMPSFGYAGAFLQHDDLPQFHLMLYSHMASYSSRGVFSSSEQLPFRADSLGRWRDYMWTTTGGGATAAGTADATGGSAVSAASYAGGRGRGSGSGQGWTPLEAGIDMCIASVLLPTLATRWQLVYEDADHRGHVWLAKGAPRRWYASTSSQPFEALHVPTAVGRISLSATTEAHAAQPVQYSHMNVSVSAPPYGAGDTALGRQCYLLHLRLRGREAGWVMRHAKVAGGPGVTIDSIDPAAEMVTVAVRQLQAVVSFSVTAVLERDV